MQPNAAESSLGQHGQEITVEQVVRIQDVPVGRWEDKVICNAVMTGSEGGEKAQIPELQKNRSQLFRHIHSARLFALRGREPPMNVVALHKNEAIGIVFVCSELNVSPLQRDQFSTTQSGAQGG
ncbi:MAG TPA: hypothetical protein VFC29_10960 [Candidatus Limnocylindrales bacterium]|nr:hypothetical protein [Candidatus Limnocylindrales bacterium]